MTDQLSQLLAERGVLLADGATGTNYFDMGLASGEAPEAWLLEHPDKVADLHRRFVEAGSDIVLTNSFGATRFRLKLHGLEERTVRAQPDGRLARAQGRGRKRPRPSSSRAPWARPASCSSRSAR